MNVLSLYINSVFPFTIVKKRYDTCLWLYMEVGCSCVRMYVMHNAVVAVSVYLTVCLSSICFVHSYIFLLRSVGGRLSEQNIKSDNVNNTCNNDYPHDYQYPISFYKERGAPEARDGNMKVENRNEKKNPQ